MPGPAIADELAQAVVDLAGLRHTRVAHRPLAVQKIDAGAVGDTTENQMPPCT